MFSLYEIEQVAHGRGEIHVGGVTLINTDELKKLRAKRDALREENSKLNRAIRCENADPNGSIWDHAAALQDKVDKLTQEIESMKMACAKHQKGGETI